MKSAVQGLLGIFFILLLFGEVAAVESRPVTSTGEATLANITPEEAQELALKRARLNAIEKVCVIKLQAETFVRNLEVEADFIHSVSYGHIVSEEILRWDVDVDQESLIRPPTITYRVSIKTEVLKEKSEPDPFYQVNVRLNKMVFECGDEMIIYVNTSKPSYLTVLNFSADGSVILLFPNQIRRNSHIEAVKEFQIPSPADRDDVLKLQVSTLPGHKRDTELIKVIATREPIGLLDGLLIRGQYGVMDTVKFAVTEIARMISSIPVRDRAEATVSYQIVSPN